MKVVDNVSEIFVFNGSECLLGEFIQISDIIAVEHLGLTTIDQVRFVITKKGVRFLNTFSISEALWEYVFSFLNIISSDNVVLTVEPKKVEKFIVKDGVKCIVFDGRTWRVQNSGTYSSLMDKIERLYIYNEKCRSIFSKDNLNENSRKVVSEINLELD